MFEKQGSTNHLAPAPQESEIHLPHRSGVFSAIASKVGILMLGASVGAVATCQKAYGVVELNGSSDSQYVGLGLNGAASSVFIPIANSYGGSFCSGVCLNPNWVLTAAHPFTDPSGNVNGTAEGVLLGTPLTASSSLDPVLASYIFPGFNNSGNGPDLMLLQLASPLSVPTLTIGTATPGSVVTSFGYGAYGTPATGMNEADGNLRGWQATVNSQVNVGYNSAYFQMTDYGFNNSGLINGMAGEGDSGGGAFNSLGQLVGITTAASSPSDPTGNTIYDNISSPAVISWENSVMGVPEPSTFGLVAVGGALLAASGLRKR